MSSIRRTDCQAPRGGSAGQRAQNGRGGKTGVGLCATAPRAEFFPEIPLDGWLVELIGRAVHVTPLGDLREHEKAETCWCGPWPVHEGVGVTVVHNSMDGREKFETGERKPS